MNNKPVWIGIAVLVAVVAIVYGVMFNVKKTTIAPTLSLPVAMDNPAVTGVFLSYNFTGVIKNLEAVGDSINLSLDSQTGGVPTFSITKNTTIYKVVLKSGIKVTIAAYYDLRTKDWHTTGIYLAEIIK